jgi:hypothetical protein
VSPKIEAMSFFQLHHGRLNLPERKIDLIPGSDGDEFSTWELYHNTQFPWQFSSMKMIEGILDSSLILKGLSFDQLPNTNAQCLPKDQ